MTTEATATNETAKTTETAAGVEGVYGGPLGREILPDTYFPAAGAAPESVYRLVHDELELDGNASQNLATFCTTWSEPEARRLMAETLGKNMIDKDEYPQTAELEQHCVRMLADLWNNPDARRALGCSTTGSSEACMLGGLAMKWRWRKARRATGLPADRPNLVCGPVQICWKKFARYFDVELREVPLLPGATGLRPEQLREYVDENTIGVVAILGVTFTCDYEPVAAIAAELDAIQADTGLDVPVHVVAASGGFIAPFAQPELVWDFRVERVVSVNASGHKYGMAPLGVGWVLWRTPAHLPEELVFRVDYLGGDMPTFALNFSRPGGEIITQYYLFLRLGREGYARIQRNLLDTAAHLGDEIAALGPFTLLYDGRGALPGVSYTLTDPDGAGFTLYDVSAKLRERGWQVAAYPLPAGRQDTVIHRVLVRREISRDKASLFLADLRRAVTQLGRTAGDSGATGPVSFHH
ncbi:glutamate decarboxylase [Streptomyces sp. IBSNAI002]|uniref:glutamate decarboxylase n=1 Tax=Streptomyces sp. IBSNAI002 TaxID=3457500 RepID=UPI003FD3399F